ncbi:MAG: DUF1559 domain-containing protein [Pirellulales bacterium]|nr:DUF1559 domain-containing protein [Pirellulales bacterium]
MAAHNFHTAQGRFPMGYETADPPRIYNVGTIFWPQAIFDYLEEHNLDEDHDFNTSLGVVGSDWYTHNDRAHTQFISAYLCPSDTRGTLNFSEEGFHDWTRSN